MRLFSLVAFGTALTACGETEAPTPKAECVQLDQLDETVWILDWALPKSKTYAKSQARIKFSQKEGKTTAKYTVLSLSNVYNFECEQKGDTLECTDKARLKDWCMALEVNQEGACTVAALQNIGGNKSSAKALKKAVIKGKIAVKKARTSKDWGRFKLVHNNLGNKLQGLLYISAKKNTCNITLTDNYMTIYNGVRKEDSNPVGANAFVPSKETYRWANCDNDSLGALDGPERLAPEKVNRQATHAIGSPVYYFYYGEDALKAEEGCTYSYDSFGQWRVSETGVAVVPDDKGSLDWHASYTFTDQTELSMAVPPYAAMFSMSRYKTCGGKKTLIDTTCNASVVR